jgi:hypothetical protein
MRPSLRCSSAGGCCRRPASIPPTGGRPGICSGAGCLSLQRAALRAHIPTTTSPSNVPELGKKLAYNANRDGVAARFPDPAVPKRMAVNLALRGADDPLLGALEWHIVTAAKQQAPLPCTCSSRCPASETSSASSGWMRSMTSSGFPAGRSSSPRVAWSHGPQNPPANAPEQPAPRAAMRLSRGRSRRRQCAFSGTIPQARHSCPDWRKTMARATR